jgi:hypothetical protein
MKTLDPKACNEFREFIKSGFHPHLWIDDIDGLTTDDSSLTSALVELNKLERDAREASKEILQRYGLYEYGIRGRFDVIYKSEYDETLKK